MKDSQHKLSKETVEKSQVVRNNVNIPQEIIDEILIILPAKSLIRFKAVSKLWHATISNPIFQGRRRPKTRIVARVAYSGLLFIDEKGSVEKFRAPAWCNLRGSNFLMSNSCNGMVLLCDGARVFLIDPSTHYIHKSELILEEFYVVNIQICIGSVGLCYDESTGVYKAVIFRKDLFNYVIQSVTVANLKEGGWKKSRIRNNLNIGYFSPGPMVHNRLHGYNGNRIVCFNLIKDVFEEVPCRLSMLGYIYQGLGVLDGCLCIVREIRKNDHRGDAEFIIMKEYGVAESWTTLFVIENLKDSSWMKPLHRTEDGNILIKIRGTIWSYNLANKSYTHFVPEGNSNIYMLDADTFVENLCALQF